MDSTLFDTGEPTQAISMTQPWAMLAVLGEKQYETRGRTWRKSHPREVYIHASKGFPKAVREFCRKAGLPDTLAELRRTHPFSTALARHGWGGDEDLPQGVILGRVRVVRSCRVEEVGDVISPTERAFGNYSDGRVAIELAAPVLFRSWVRCDGALGLWKVPDVVLQTMRRAA